MGRFRMDGMPADENTIFRLAEMYVDNAAESSRLARETREQELDEEENKQSRRTSKSIKRKNRRRELRTQEKAA